MVSTGTISAIGLSVGAYTVLTAGIGLVVAGAAAGVFALVKSNWKHEEANKNAVEQLLVKMEEGQAGMIK